MHIGKTKEEYKCQNLFIDKWEEKEMEDCDRVNKGIGIVKKILTMLEGIPFGKFNFEAGVIMRNSLLVI